MNKPDPLAQAAKIKYPFPVRVSVSALPIAAVILPLLWLTEYPAEEWPFISGVFALSVVGAGTLIGYIALFAVRRVHGYASGVASKWGIDIAETGDRTSNSRRVRVVSTLVTMLLLVAATWGLALVALSLTMGQLAMPAIGPHMRLIALAMFVTGTVGFSAIVGGLALFFHTADRYPHRIRRLSVGVHYWVNIAGYIGQRGQIPIAPTLTSERP